ncbi:MAG: thioesterase family protein [Ilumatobacter sp.]
MGLSGAFFDVEGSGAEEVFRPTDHCRGPWDADACHAGPPSGLIARAVERLLPDHRLVRLTVELSRPVPHRGFRVEAEVARAGRSVATAAARIIDMDGREVASARTHHLAPAPSPLDVTSAPLVTPSFDDSYPDRFTVARSIHDLPAFMDGGVETRYGAGSGPEGGPTVMWLRTVPLITGETMSGFQRICPLADCGNGTSRNGSFDDWAFLNTDLNVNLHREPIGEWFAIDSVSVWEPDGIGLSDSVLLDVDGRVGRATQTLMVRSA